MRYSDNFNIHLDWLLFIGGDLLWFVKLTCIYRAGIWEKATFEDFLVIGALLLFSAMQNHGLNVLSFLSTTVQRSPHAPLGWSVLHRKNGRAILLSVYTNDTVENLQQEAATQGMRLILSRSAKTAFVLVACYYKFVSCFCGAGFRLLIVCDVHNRLGLDIMVRRVNEEYIFYFLLCCFNVFFVII